MTGIEVFEAKILAEKDLGNGKIIRLQTLPERLCITEDDRKPYFVLEGFGDDHVIFDADLVPVLSELAEILKGKVTEAMIDNAVKVLFGKPERLKPTGLLGE